MIIYIQINNNGLVDTEYNIFGLLVKQVDNFINTYKTKYGV